MTDELEGLSEIEKIEADPRLRAELAAARLASTIGALMDAVEEATPVLQKDIAHAMRVTPGRVSQILSGDGNVKIATLGRFLDAAGYDLELVARPKSGQGATIVLPKAPRRRHRMADTPTVKATPLLAFSERVVVATGPGTKFVHHDGLQVMVDGLHDLFPVVAEAARSASRRTTWKISR